LEFIVEVQLDLRGGEGFFHERLHAPSLPPSPAVSLHHLFAWSAKKITEIVVRRKVIQISQAEGLPCDIKQDFAFRTKAFVRRVILHKSSDDCKLGSNPKTVKSSKLNKKKSEQIEKQMLTHAALI